MEQFIQAVTTLLERTQEQNRQLQQTVAGMMQQQQQNFERMLLQQQAQNNMIMPVRGPAADIAKLLRKPEPYSGSRNTKAFNNWKQSIIDYIENNPSFATESQKIIFIISYLSGAALYWVRTRRKLDENAFANADDLLNELESHFKEINANQHARERWQTLRQTNSVGEYTSLFIDLLLQINATDEEQLYKYRSGLKPYIQMELARRDGIEDLQELMNTADNIEQRFRQLNKFNSSSSNSNNRQDKSFPQHKGFSSKPVSKQSSNKPSPSSSFNSKFSSSSSFASSSSGPVPMEINSARISSKTPSKLTEAEREAFTKEVKCTYCRKPGHIIADCETLAQKRKQQLNQSAMTYSTKSSNNDGPSSESPFVFPVVIEGIKLTALIDSGATSNALSAELLDDNIPLASIVKTNKYKDLYSVDVASGPAVKITHFTNDLLVEFGDHRSLQSFNIIPSLSYNVILGRPWLKHCDPVINWTNDCITLASSTVNRIPTEVSSSELLIIDSKEFKATESEVESVSICSITSINEQKTKGEFKQEEEKGILEEFKDVFPDDLPAGLPPSRGKPFQIELIPDAKPPVRGIYNMSQHELQVLREQLKDLVDKGFIQPSRSPFGAPVLLVKKKDGSYRMVVDYRDINKITIKNSYPLPNMMALFDTLYSAKVFSKMDLKSGYNQIPIAKKDIHKTAFRTRYGSFEFKVLPFGLTNAPGEFMELMQSVFQDLLDKCVVVYLDDILIFSSSIEEHMMHLRVVLQRLREQQLFAKLEKCEFFKRQVEFLGHIVGVDGISMDQAKVKAIMDWPIPTSQKLVMAFLGLANFYRRFIKDFSRISLPLTELTKADYSSKNTFIWNEEHGQAFEELKKSVSSAPVLKIADPSKPYTLSTDASGFAVGGVISQEHDKVLYPIAFESKKLNPAEKNYPTHDKELLAIVHCVKKWRMYLDGAKFTVFTDHHTLSSFLNWKTYTSRQSTWAVLLSQYDISIIYKPGKLNVVADALSRRSDLAALAEAKGEGVMSSPPQICTIMTSDFNPFERVTNSYTNNELVTQLLKYLESNDKMDCPKSLLSSRRFFSKKDGIIYYRDKLWIPNGSLRSLIIKESHDLLPSGHLGSDKTMERILRTYSWPHIEQQVRSYCKSCLICQRSKHRLHSPSGLLLPLDPPKAPWSHISMDLIVQLPPSGPYDAIFVVVDRFTKMSHFIPTKTNAGAPDLAILFVNHIYKLHGCPENIISDRDSRFLSTFWSAFMELIGVTTSYSTSYHPQTDGQTERMNQTLETMLRCFSNELQDNWSELLPVVEFAYNDSFNASTRQTPFMLNYGITPRSLPTQMNQGIVEEANKQGKSMDEARRIAWKSLLKAMDYQKQAADKNRIDAPKYRIGDKVMLNTKNLSIKSSGEKATRKLAPKFIGPFPIIEVINKVAFRLTLPAYLGRIHNVFHASLLEPYVAKQVDHNFESEFTRPPDPIVRQPATQILDLIVASKIENNKILFLVKWIDRPDHENTWVSPAALDQLLRNKRKAIH